MLEDNWKILLIDDDEGIRKVLSLTLEDAGFSVLNATNGRNGIELCRQQSPQIIITDIRMPDMSGLDVLKEIKKLDPDKEVIVVTGYGGMKHAINALQLDASDFITKPISDSALWIALERAKERYKTRKELRDYSALLEERWMSTAEELARTFNFKNQLIESSIDGIVGCDKQEKIIIFNESMEQMLGYSQEKIIGKVHFHQLFSPKEWERFEKKLYSEEHGGKNKLLLCETGLISKTGTRIPVQLSATVLFQDRKKRIGIVGFFRDLSRIRQLEQQFEDQARLLHQDKMISLGKLAASVVHEINNPLAGVLNYIRLMIKVAHRDTVTPEQMQKFQRYLGLMEGEISRCSNIVSNLLAFSRRSKLEFNQVNINDLLQKCLLLSEHKLALQNIRIETRLYPEIPMVSGDFNQLQQCVLNLIFNAIDSMPDGGVLKLNSSFDKTGRVVEIRVEDRGRGIPREELRCIFDPFFTTKKEGKGLGLGLSVVFGIIDRHKGTIGVESELNKGTTFTIKLPLRE